ncbi:MAG TPA: oligosaccharide flippase family protein [Bacteroidia bacterium]
MNYFSSGLNVILSIIFVPIYLKYIGAEGYGLIGVFASLQGILSVLDAGLGGALSREIALRSGKADSDSNKIADLVKTLGSIYWLIALVIGIIAVAVSPLIANHWVKPVLLSNSQIVTVFILLSCSLVFYFPIGFYSGGFVGLQRQSFLNVLKIIFAIIKYFGSLLVLIYSTDKLTAFFVWNLVVNSLQAVVFKFAFWYCLPARTRKPLFSRTELSSVWKYAAGLTGISITALILGQIDRIVLSKTLSLEEFGYYSLAGSIVVLIYQIIQPINQTFFPKFTGLTLPEKSRELRGTYRLAYQIVSLVIIPATLTLAFFSNELLFFLTHNIYISNETWITLSVMTISVGLNALLNIPYQLTLAFGWTKYALLQNIVMIIILTPLTIWLTLNYGAIGGASSSLILNGIWVLILPYIIHRKILQKEQINWYLYGALVPVILNGLFLFSYKWLLDLNILNRISNVLLIGFGTIICLFINTFVLREIRLKAKEILLKKER